MNLNLLSDIYHNANVKLTPWEQYKSAHKLFITLFKFCLKSNFSYVEWRLHEKKSGVFDFAGDLDLENFLSIAQEEGLLVLLRPGPYICAERDLVKLIIKFKT